MCVRRMADQLLLRAEASPPPRALLTSCSSPPLFYGCSKAKLRVSCAPATALLSLEALYLKLSCSLQVRALPCEEQVPRVHCCQLKKGGSQDAAWAGLEREAPARGS